MKDTFYQEKVHNERFKLILFTLYTILYEGMVWGGFVWLVIISDGSAWWFLAALILSGVQLGPKYFGLPYKLEEDEED